MDSEQRLPRRESLSSQRGGEPPFPAASSGGAPLGRTGSQLEQFEQELATALSISAAAAASGTQQDDDDLELSRALSASLASMAAAPAAISRPASSPPSAAMGVCQPDEAKVANLIGLGFEPAAARQALEAAGGSEELAVEILFG